MREYGTWLAVLPAIFWAVAQRWNFFDDIYMTLSTASVVTLVAITGGMDLRRSISLWFRLPTGKSIALGLLTGGVLVLLTHAGMDLLLAFSPGFRVEINDIYRANGITNVSFRLRWF